MKVRNEIDFLVAQGRAEKEIAEEIVDSIRKKGDYYQEKLALKMLDFFREEEKIITLYAEAKMNYPLLAELMESKRPYLKDLLSEAKKLYEQNANN